jgi:predicted PurR-regulated permease PerM
MNFWEKLVITAIIITTAILFIDNISNVLFPFIIAGIFAYFLAPTSKFLSDKIGSPNLVTTIIISIFFILLIILSITIIPLLFNQLASLLHAMPLYIDNVKAILLPKIINIAASIEPESITKLENAAQNISLTIFKQLGSTVIKMLESSFALVNVLSLIFVTPIITFYTLRDWDKITNHVMALVPNKYYDVTIEQFRAIDTTLSGYIRGQTNVCLMLAAYYAIGLSILGLNYGFVIGMLTGIFAFIPYVGVIAGFTAAILVGIFQFGFTTNLFILIGILAFGQFVEGNFISPRLVGNRVGLHPVWMIFSLLVGGSLMGFVGVLISVPVASIIAIFIRLFIKKYKNSMLFQ